MESKFSISSIGTYNSCPKKYKFKYKKSLWRKLLDTFSFSKVSTYNTCARKYKINYLDEVITEPDTYLETGFLVHLGIEHILTSTGTPKQRLNNALYELSQMNEEYHLDDIERAKTILKAHATPDSFIINCKPTNFIEFGFEEEVDGITITGVIDAVVEYKGRFYLVDWKVRSRFYTELDIANDAQLQIYAWILENRFNTKIDKAFQYQISRSTPSIPQLTLEGEIDKRLGKTTEEMFEQYLVFYGWSQEKIEEAKQQYKNKFVDSSEWRDIIEVNLDKKERYLQEFIQTAKKILNDNEYLPVNSAYICKSCPFLSECLNR